MPSNDVVRYLPGDEVEVEIVADSGDAVATKGDLVEINGENEAHVEVVGIQSQGNESIGVLQTVPRELAKDDVSASDLTSGDSAGTAVLRLTKPIYNLNVDSGYTASVGDLVQETTGGVEAYAGAASQAATPLGIVFETLARDFGHGDGVGVAIFR
jgi:hypothetical protein